MEKNRLSERAQKLYARQSYDAAPGIDGLVVKEVPFYPDDGGLFAELGRFDAGLHQLFPDFELRQVSYSLLLPGAIKAFHLHLQQEDIWFVSPSQRLLAVVCDERRDSPTAGRLLRLSLGEGKAKLLYIPRGVAHGAANLSNEPVSLIYFVNQQFNRDNSDEGRLPWDYLGEDVWKMVRG